MKTVGIAEARKNIGRLIDYVVETGESICITKHKKPYVMIVPIDTMLNLPEEKEAESSREG